MICDYMKAKEYLNIKGWDSETFRGIPYLIGYYDLATGKYRYIWNDVKYCRKPEYQQKIFDFLTFKDSQKTLNVFYNIQFDFESLLKGLTGNKKDVLLYEIAKYNKGFWKNVLIESIPKRRFIVRGKQFYDAFQFFGTSLKRACERFNIEFKKKHININWDDWNEVKERKKDLIEYHEYDCKALSYLMKNFIGGWEKINVEFWKPISMGKIAGDFILKNCPRYNTEKLLRKMKMKNRTIQKELHIKSYKDFITHCYTGGLFDIWKRGFFEKVYTYDMNSAYPYTIKNLIGMKKINIHYIDDYDEEYEYSFYLCDCDFQKPFKAIKLKSEKGHFVNFYCIGLHENIILSMNEIKFINKLGWKLNIKEGIGIECVYYEKIYEDIIESTYQKRVKSKDDLMKYLIKILMNSIYGKMHQELYTYEMLQDVTKYKDEKKIINEIYKYSLDYKKVELHSFGNGKSYIMGQKLRYGPIFNRIFSTMITEETRLKLLEIAYKNYNHVIMFNQDSITLDIPVKVPISHELGDFSIDTDGWQAWILNSGIYWYRKGFRERGKLRGIFLDLGGDDAYVRKSLPQTLLAHSKEKFFMTYYARMKHLKESLKQDKIYQINNMVKMERLFNVNCNLKRDWERDFDNCGDAYINKIESKAFNIQELIK